MKDKLLRFWARVAVEAASLSTCERTKVGAVLVSSDGERMLAMGYNGGLREGDNRPTEICAACGHPPHGNPCSACAADGPSFVCRGGKTMGGDVPGTDFWVHAEANALVKSRPFEPFRAVLTHTPCYRCAQLLINARVERVYCLDLYRDPAGFELLKTHRLVDLVGDRAQSYPSQGGHGFDS